MAESREKKLDKSERFATVFKDETVRGWTPYLRNRIRLEFRKRLRFPERQDAIQMAMIDLFKNEASWKKDEALGYLLVAARNRCRDLLRKKQAMMRSTHPEIPLDDPENEELRESIVDTGLLPGTPVEDREFAERVLAWLDQVYLPPSQVPQIVRMHLEGMPFTDIAMRLDSPMNPDAVRKAYDRALELTREVWQPRG
jgi:RNA polymerase sigma factor (sigma-70 family)